MRFCVQYACDGGKTLEKQRKQRGLYSPPSRNCNDVASISALARMPLSQLPIKNRAFSQKTVCKKHEDARLS